MNGAPGGPTTSIVISLQGDRLEPATGRRVPANYHVLFLGADGVQGTADDEMIAIGGPGIDLPVVTNPGANVNPATGLTYPVAIRQTVTLLFAEALPAGDYMIELSEDIQTAPFNEGEKGLLADQDMFGAHPVVSVSGGEVIAGAAVSATVSQRRPGAISGVFEDGTAFLTQLHGDLGVVLDSFLSDQEDDLVAIDAVYQQALARLLPALGDPDNRALSLLVLILDPPGFEVEDSGGDGVIYGSGQRSTRQRHPRFHSHCDQQCGDPPHRQSGAKGTDELTIDEPSETTRGGWILITDSNVTVEDLTSDMQDGMDNFQIEVP